MSTASTRPTRAEPDRGSGSEEAPETDSSRNEVVLAGRLSAQAEERELPSGNHLVTLRVVIPRKGARRRRAGPEGGGARPVGVDTIDVVCWTAVTRRAALRLSAGDIVSVEGALRRRFFGGPTGRQSRYEVEASALRRVGGRARRGT
ncbi:MAG: single-stranded DNA-binding protein [Terracoccus sp.]